VATVHVDYVAFGHQVLLHATHSFARTGAGVDQIFDVLQSNHSCLSRHHQVSFETRKFSDFPNFIQIDHLNNTLFPEVPYHHRVLVTACKYLVVVFSKPKTAYFLGSAESVNQFLVFVVQADVVFVGLDSKYLVVEVLIHFFNFAFGVRVAGLDVDFSEVKGFWVDFDNVLVVLGRTQYLV